MIKINKEVVKTCASNLKFELEDAQIDLLLSEFDSLIAQMKFLDAVKGADQLEPMAYPYEVMLTDDCMRDDEVGVCESADEELKNTKNRLGNQVKIPKVLG